MKKVIHMNVTLSFGLFLCAAHICVGAEKTVFGKRVVTMPDKALLEHRLRAWLPSFVNPQDMLNRLAGKELYPLGIAYIVREALYKHPKYTKKDPTPADCLLLDDMQAEPFLFEALLQDDMWALDELAAKGYYRPACKDNQKKIKVSDD